MRVLYVFEGEGGSYLPTLNTVACSPEHTSISNLQSLSLENDDFLDLFSFPKIGSKSPKPNTRMFFSKTTPICPIQRIIRSGSVKNECIFSPNMQDIKTLTKTTFRVQSPDIPRSRRSGPAHGGTARRSVAGQDRTPTGRFPQGTTVPLALQGPKASKTPVLNVSPGARTNKIICQIQNPDILRVGRDPSAHGGTAGRGGDGQDGTPTDRFAQETAVPLTLQTIENNPPGRVSGSTNKRNPM